MYSPSPGSLKVARDPPTLGGVLDGCREAETAPKRGGGGWGGGGRGGIPASFPSRSPPPKQPFQPTPRLRQAPTRRFAKNRNRFGWFLWGKGPRPLVAGPQAPPLRPGPQAPGAWIPPLSLVDFLAKFLTFCCVSKSWVRVSKP